MTPARRVILAVGVPVALALIAFGTSGFVNRGVIELVGRDVISVPVSLSVPAGGHVRVAVSSANVTLAAGAGRLIRVHGTVRGGYSRPTFSAHATAAGLSVAPRCRLTFEYCSANLTVTAPAGLPVAVSTSFGDLDARALRGTIALSDNSGDLDASGLAGTVRLSDEFGDLTAAGLTGSIQLDNDSGDISAAGLTGDTRLSDSFGDIAVTGLSAADVTASNNSGDITLTFTKVPQRVVVTDSFGDITLRLPPGPTAYQVHARTSFASKTISVPQSATSPDVITATNDSGDITITN
jgi:hypothetical protein